MPETKKVTCEECRGKGIDDRAGIDPTLCDICDGVGEYEVIECRACSIAGGADCPVYHDPPACKD